MTTTVSRRAAELALVEPAPPGLRARQLLDEARKASREHLGQLAAGIEELRRLAEAVLEAGDLYAPGVHDLAERLAEELFWRSQSLEKLTQGASPSSAAAEPAREVG